jgi:hypothetical protein
MLGAKLTDLTQVTVLAGRAATHLVMLLLDPLALSALRVRVVHVVALRPVFDSVDIGHTTTVRRPQRWCTKKVDSFTERSQRFCTNASHGDLEAGDGDRKGILNRDTPEEFSRKATAD